ncbi:MAG: hypothetical protein KTR26_16355 [Flammeovirgaceae bacterium]|nr:hypothetical protein [Flammeovirgaceae bacterium]
MRKKYSIKLENNLKAAFLTIISAIVLYLIFYFQNGIVGNIILIIIISPSLFVHLNYLIEDYKKEVIVDRQSRVFKYQKDDVFLEYKFHELIEIIKCETLLNRFPVSTYHYFKITSHDGKEMIVTCLIFRRFPIKDKQIGEGLKIFPFV